MRRRSCRPKGSVFAFANIDHMVQASRSSHHVYPVSIIFVLECHHNALHCTMCFYTPFAESDYLKQ
ncbi:hypothetical protein Zm00014a_013805 [Zea mays]|uniref:Uncharacterized protein n=1 Tax=Zea mays TaxID=4577 RepID=A0A3L6EE29_MAIZE|nr:hypothetical protein Zm00014a_013805 [Zea mays]